eukprot:7378966-Pyramimonas_sp.AAC.1
MTRGSSLRTRVFASSRARLKASAMAQKSEPQELLASPYSHTSSRTRPSTMSGRGRGPSNLGRPLRFQGSSAVMSSAKVVMSTSRSAKELMAS